MIKPEGLRRTQGFVVWLTGLPCAGKSALARELCLYYKHQGRFVVVDEHRISGGGVIL